MIRPQDVKTWLRPHHLAKPFRRDRLVWKDDKGDDVIIHLHPAYQEVQEAEVVFPAHNPKHGPIMYTRMGYAQKEAFEKTREVVASDIEAGDIIGIPITEIKYGGHTEEQNRVHTIDNNDELFEVNFSSVYYYRKPGSEELVVTPGWMIIELVDKDTIIKVGEYQLERLPSKEPMKGVVKYVSHGEDGSKAFLGVDPGDTILFANNMELPIKIGGKPHAMIAHSQVLAKEVQPLEPVLA